MSQFISPKVLYYGESSLNKLEHILDGLKVKKVFLLTDPILKKLGVINPVIKFLSKRNIIVDINTNVVPEPPIKIGNEVVESVRKSKPDLVIGVGGGSTLDLAKIAAVLTENKGDIEDYLNLSGTKKIINKGLPKVLIPTTSGTGSEVTDIDRKSTRLNSCHVAISYAVFCLKKKKKNKKTQY